MIEDRYPDYNKRVPLGIRSLIYSKTSRVLVFRVLGESPSCSVLGKRSLPNKVTYRCPGQDPGHIHLICLFPPSVLNVNETTPAVWYRTNNLCEAWNNSFISLICYLNHPIIWACLEGLKNDCRMVCMSLTNHAIGIPLKKDQKKLTCIHD
jgi:hypothetical protein